MQMRNPPPTSRRWLAPAVCAALLILFGALSYSASVTKSATYDEPMHAVGAWVHRHLRDFRINFEDPPLWHYWAALPHGPEALQPDLQHNVWLRMLEVSYAQWPFTVLTLYHTPGVDGEAFVQRSRAMMVILGVALGALVAWWSWRIGGAVVAVAATLGFALDPTFLGHAPLVKNDVAMSLATFALAAAVWGVGRRATAGRIVLVGLLLGVAINLKFSAILLGPILAVMLALRAMIGGEWRVLRWNLATPARRLVASASIVIFSGFVAYGCIWATYGFRFSATPDPDVRLNSASIQREAAAYSIRSERGQAEMPTTQEIEDWQPGPLVHLINFALKYRLLPEAWLNGLLFVHARSFIRAAYLMGDVSITGWWYYFPLALTFKSATATLTAAALAVVFWLALRIRRGREHSGVIDRWTLVCLATPPAIYVASAMASNLNIGVRHMLPAMPFFYVMIALGMATMLRQWRRGGPVVAGALVLMLAVEVISAWPNYIAFFNTPSGGTRGGLRLLSDSNLDWGQDLRAMAEWRFQNPHEKLYLAYFGMADPAAYGIHYINAPEGYIFGPPTQEVEGPAILAVSATLLQGTYLADNPYLKIRETLTPFQILNGTIYLYRIE